MNRRRLVALRNFAILVAVSGLGVVWGEGLNAGAGALNQVMLVLFLAVIVLMAYRYFGENRLKWLVIKPWLRGVVIVCALGILALVVTGPFLLADRISPGAVWALIGVLGLIILWVVQQSRKY